MVSKTTVNSKQKLPVLLQKKDGVTPASEKITPGLKKKSLQLIKSVAPSKIAKTTGANTPLLPGFVGGLKQTEDVETIQKPSLDDVSKSNKKTKETLIESLNKLYGLHKKIIQLEKSDFSDNRKKEKQQLKDRENRHKEILYALESLSISTDNKPKQKKTPSKKSKKQDSKEKKESKKGSKKGKGKSKTKKSFVGSLVSDYGMQAVAVGGVAAFGIADKISKPAGENVSTSTPVSYGKPAPSGQSTVLNAMAGAESGNNYDIAYGDRVDNKGKMYNVAGVPTAEEYSGKKLSQMTLDEVEQFQKARNSKVKNTGAVGKYQFISTTLFNKGGLVEKLGMDKKTTLFNQDTQDRLAMLLLEGNTATLKAAGIPESPANQYMSWYVGPAGAVAVHKAIRNGKGDLSVAEAIVDAGHQDPSTQNKELKEIKAKDFESVLAQRMSIHGAPSGTEMASAPQSVPQTASQVRVTSGFGLRNHPVTGQRDKMHEGMDLAGKLGDPVFTTGDGTVTIPNEDPKGYGKWVIVNHADGVQTYYAHLSEITVKQGQQVKTGQSIGKVGNTGMSTGPHLHYQVMQNGKAVDPASSNIPTLTSFATAMTGTGAMEPTMVAQNKPDIQDMSVVNKDLRETVSKPIPVVINNINTIDGSSSDVVQSYVITASKEQLSRESALMWSQRGYS